MKNKIFDNFALKILAILCAILLWLVVLNISDYTITVEIKDIPVEQLNGDVLEELDQIYDVEKGDTVSILVKGRRSVVDRLSASDFVATADLSEMSITNTVQIHVDPKNKNLSDSISITLVDSTMSLRLEEKISVQFPVRINVKGEAKDGYASVTTAAVPNLITLTGPKSAIGRVTDVCVDVNISGRSDSFDTFGDVYLSDAYGEKYENDKIVLSEQSVKISAMIYPTKQVDVNVSVTGRPDDGYAVGDISYQPQTVTIAGAAEDIKSITELYIDDISVSGQSENLQTTIDLTKYLPENVYLAQNSSEVAVNITVEKLVQKTIEVVQKDISLINKQNGCTYTVTVSDDCKITASGLAEVIDLLDINSFSPTIDCTNLRVGDNQAVEVSVKDMDGVDYTISGTVNVHVNNVKSR